MPDFNGVVHIKNNAGTKTNITLDGQNGFITVSENIDTRNLSIKDGNGHVHMSLFSGVADFNIGGNGADGTINISNAASHNVITLDAATGDIILRNADCAEDFDITETEEIGPGTVVVIDTEGRLRQSTKAYDRCVAGVISGAGGFKPGLLLDKQPSPTVRPRLPVALVGKVYCQADAAYSVIAVGDLLTTSPTPGYAMKATDRRRAFGAVIGKALCPLDAGRGLIPILIALQ